MNSRERVRLALNHKEADRVPLDMGGFQSGMSYETYMKVKEKLGINSPTVIVEPLQGLAKLDEEVLKLWNIDTRYVFSKAPKDFNGTIPEDGTFTDKYGIEWVHSFYSEWWAKWYRRETSKYYELTDSKLKNYGINDLDKFPWPDPKAVTRNEGLKKEVEDLFNNTEYAIFCSGPGLFEHSWEIYGLQEYLYKMADEPKYIEKLLDKLVDNLIGIYSNFLDITGPYLDCFELYSDLGTQVGSFISPKYYRDVIKPRDKKLISAMKAKTNAKICLHSCGDVYDFIPDIIDAGYDVLNPVQTNARSMDPIRLKKEFGKDLAFWGAIDTQKVLPFGTVDEVRKEVRSIINVLGKGGGYILGSCHNILAGVPVDNIIAMWDEAYKSGRYPLNIQ